MVQANTETEKICQNCTHCQLSGGFLLGVMYHRTLEKRRQGTVRITINDSQAEQADGLLQQMFGKENSPMSFSVDCGSLIRALLANIFPRFQENMMSNAACIRPDKFSPRDWGAGAKKVLGL